MYFKWLKYIGEIIHFIFLLQVINLVLGFEYIRCFCMHIFLNPKEFNPRAKYSLEVLVMHHLSTHLQSNANMHFHVYYIF